MDFTQEFNRLIKDTPNIALATAANDTPNVRLLNFYYDENRKGVIYFTAFKGSSKVKEFSQNNIVSFTTVPIGHHEHVRVGKGIVRESELKMPELVALYAKKYPGVEKTLPMGDMIGVYEVHFDEAHVTLGVNQSGKVVL